MTVKSKPAFLRNQPNEAAFGRVCAKVNDSVFLVCLSPPPVFHGNQSIITLECPPSPNHRQFNCFMNPPPIQHIHCFLSPCPYFYFILFMFALMDSSSDDDFLFIGGGGNPIAHNLFFETIVTIR